jgi:hypothetical protein
MSPHLWAMNSSCKAEVFSYITTMSMAIVGTSEIIILLNAFAIGSYVFDSSNLRVYIS